MESPKTKILKGGWRMDAPAYSVPVRRFLIEQIKNRRPLVEIYGDALRGVRFNDDISVSIRVESNYDEETFMACPAMVVDAMLLDAAQSDYWYTFEKDYDDEPDDEGEIDDE